MRFESSLYHFETKLAQYTKQGKSVDIEAVSANY